jgi:hypothetical protein
MPRIVGLKQNLRILTPPTLRVRCPLGNGFSKIEREKP